MLADFSFAFQSNLTLGLLNWSNKSWAAMCKHFEGNGVFMDGPAVYALPLLYNFPVFILFSLPANEECYLFLPTSSAKSESPLLLANWSLVHFSTLAPKFGAALAVEELRSCGSHPVSEALRPRLSDAVTRGEDTKAAESVCASFVRSFVPKLRLSCAAPCSEEAQTSALS